MSLPAVRVAIVLLFAINSAEPASKASFLIIENPRALIFYNQYQQLLTDDERSKLPWNMPVKLIDETTVLSDGFTPCLKGEINGTSVFILRTESGPLQGIQGAGRISLVRNVSIINDTLESLTDNLGFSASQESVRQRIAPGMLFHRLFASNGTTFVKLMGTREAYGWMDFRKAIVNHDWKRVEGVGLSRAEQLRKVLPQIYLKLKEANGKLSELFHRFQPGKGDAPQWSAEVTGSGIVCLLGSRGSVALFANSSQQLSKTLETLLLGTNLQIRPAAGRIEIQ